MSSAKHLIFVYGTLKKGWGNHRILEGQEYLGHAETTNPEWAMYSLGGFPGVVSGDKCISGELYAVDGEALYRCDRLEGHPTFYERSQVEVSQDEGETLQAWMYIYQGKTDGLQELEVW